MKRLPHEVKQMSLDDLALALEWVRFWRQEELKESIKQNAGRF